MGRVKGEAQDGTELVPLGTLENVENERSIAINTDKRKASTHIPADKLSLKIDEILRKSGGGFARYQIFLILCLGLGGALYAAVQNLSMTFVESSAPWKCLTANCANRTNSKVNEKQFDIAKLCKANLDTRDWEWEDPNHTAISDYNQACGTQTIVTNVLYFCPGVMVGGIIFGIMGWSTGRKTPFLSALLTSMVASVISAASTDYILFIVLRVLLGASIGGYELLYFCWIVELVSKKWRPLAVGIQGIFWSAGLLVVLYINESWTYWRLKMVYVGIVSLLFIFVYAAVPESPYWLLAKGQDDVATMVLKRISILNNKTYPDIPITIPHIKARERVIALFQPRYKRVGLYFCLNWLLVGLVYYHIFLTLDTFGVVEGVHLPDLKKTNYVIAVAVEVPATMLGAALLASVLGRKFAYLFNLAFFTVCIAISLVQYSIVPGWDVRRCAVLIGAKWSITAAKMILALWTTEIAPTTIRTLFYGMCLASSATGVVVASALIYFAASPFCTSIAMISLAVVCMAAATQVFDTSKWNLPDNLFDVYKNMNNGLQHTAYSDLQSEPQPATVL